MAEEISTIKAVTEVERMDTRARYRYLREQWGISELRVRGRLEKRQKDLWWLTDVRSEGGRLLRYPLADLNSKPGLGVPGVFVGSEAMIAADLREPGTHVIVEVHLASEGQRVKWKNPLLICADPTSMEPLTRIAREHVYRNDDGSIDLEETLCRGYIDARCAQARDELSTLNEEVARLKKDHADVATQFHALRREREETERTRDQALRELAEAEANSRHLAQEVEDRFAARRERLEKDARDRESALSQNYEEHERKLRQELDAIAEELTAARRQRDRKLGDIQTQADALLAYVKSRIEPLHRLELITDAQWDALFPDVRNTADQAGENLPIFEGETTQAIDHIQRYLFGKGIGYPRDLLENFHALLCTGDLIILSGLSGSGKTNLVKSYADATGNVARIVPVKPNWTSAEDLLGFHNPLQRAYATTPFLEALFDASRDPERLYILCLDEMNLARVEYYFADFLSCLEDREDPSIPLYPDDEAGHVLTELRVLMRTLEGVTLDLGSADLETLLADGPSMAQIARRLGLGDGESFAQLHSRVRRMLSGALKVPARFKIPANVRFVGAVNMDDTTQYLTPKVLDRAHVLQFRSPLDYWQRVCEEVGEAERPTHPIRIPARVFPPRAEYPSYRSDDPLVSKLTEYVESFLAPLGIELGMRPMRQAIHYRDRLADLYEEGEDLDFLALNNLLRQKVFPRFSFDGKQSALRRGEQTRNEVACQLRDRLGNDLSILESEYGRPLLFQASDDLASMIERARANDGVYSYWA